MRIAIVCSNVLTIDESVRKGTEISVWLLTRAIVKQIQNTEMSLTAFCSGDSRLPIKTESIDFHSTSFDTSIPAEKHIIFELALISKAFSMQNEFDLYHINIGNGDIVLPFARFVKKPILITLHYTIEEEYAKKYFSLFKDIPNVFFVSISNSQRKLIPQLPYIATIYHGIDAGNFTFNEIGGENIVWAGRAIPQKGMDIALDVAKQTKRPLTLFGITKTEHKEWLETVLEEINQLKTFLPVSIFLNKNNLDLVEHYQKSKLFLFPIRWEEPFGLVLTEAMSCGTPVVAYARGSVPEIVKDGETGFIVNSSDDDRRGEWIVKKTGVEGLVEAVERIYSLPEERYREMRKNCRNHVERNFTVEKMANEYIKVYQKAVSL